MDYTLPDNKLSPSRVSTFNRCPACFEWLYVLRQPARMHIALPRGIAVHAGVQSARNVVMQGGEVDPHYHAEWAVERYDEEWRRIDPAHLDLGSTAYKAPADGSQDVYSLSEAAIRGVVMARDARVGILECEARVDYSHIFPFEFECYLDALLVDGTFADLKTANRAEAPDVWSYIQLRLYAMPWYLASQPTQLVIDQVALPTKKEPSPRVSFYEAEASPEKFEAARKLVLDTAAAISTGIFPARPGWWCKTEHSLAA